MNSRHRKTLKPNFTSIAQSILFVRTVYYGLLQPAAILVALIAPIALLAPLSAHARTITGPVIGVADGDTITILDDRQQIRIRLGEIDAPESGQSFGDRSKQSLAEMCRRTTATVLVTDTDRYGRTIGRVMCDGIDVNAEQVRRGMAWVYDQYVIDRDLYRLQDEAKAARRGLWSDKSPTAPWDWRRQQRVGEVRSAAPEAQAAASGEVRGNQRSMIYHVPGCEHYNAISPRNVVVFRTEAEARAAGYRKAGNCR